MFSASIPNPPHTAQLEDIPTIPSSYIQVRDALVWECGERQTDRHTDSCDQYTFRLGYDSCEM